MKISTKAYCAIASFEGFRATAYKCPSGIWTIGYGHTKGVKKGDMISYQEASKLLMRDIEEVENKLASLGTLTQGQLDSLVSFVFNVGFENFNNSTLKKKVIANRFDKSIGKEFKRWIYSKGKVLQGLVKRREWEARRYYE